jgi:type I restriction enzyme M protein
MKVETLLKQLTTIMDGDAGVDGDAQRLSQIAWLLFLKIFDYTEENWERTEEDYQAIIPEGYRWRDWAVGDSVKAQLTGDDLIDFINNQLFPVLRGDSVKDETGKEYVLFEATDSRSLLVKEFMRDSINHMKSGIFLREVIQLFEEVDFSDSGEHHQFNEIYETLLRRLQSAGRYGEFYTGRALTRFCVDKVNPQIGESIADFACGTGGFLIEALKHLQKQIKEGDLDGNEMLQHSLHGVEKKQLPYMLCTTNLLLNGISEPDIVHGNSLEMNVFDYTESDKFDVILMNPPYGGKEQASIQNNFPVDLYNSETADLFMVEILYRLKKNGRVAIILPDGFLFGSDRAKINIKRKLMNECNLHTIIRLPNSCFAPYTSIATNILFFDKTGSTKETWFYRMDLPEGYKAFSKTKPLLRSHLSCVDEWWDHRTELEDTETDSFKAKKFSYEEIEASGFDLDLCGYPTKEEVILSPEETIRNFQIQREILNKQMDEQLSRILELLGVSEC